MYQGTGSMTWSPEFAIAIIAVTSAMLQPAVKTVSSGVTSM